MNEDEAGRIAGLYRRHAGAWASALLALALLVMFAVLLVLGMFMEQISMMLLTVPIFFPVVMELGYDPIWFGVIIVMVTEMGVITPPVGINVYVVYGVAKAVLEKEIPLEKIFKGITPFLVAVIAGIFILMLFPSIILFLPRLMY